MAELARATGHSTRSLTTYLEELRRSEVAVVYRAANQHELGRVEICDRFWPYVKLRRLPIKIPNKRCMSHAFAVSFWSRHVSVRSSPPLTRNWRRSGIGRAYRSIRYSVPF